MLRRRALIIGAIHVAILFLCFVIESTTEEMPFISALEESLIHHPTSFFASVCSILLPTVGLLRLIGTSFKPGFFITAFVLSVITSSLLYGWGLAWLSVLPAKRNDT